MRTLPAVISLVIIAVGVAATVAALLGAVWSLELGGFVSGILGILWLLAWVIYFRWA